MGRKGGKGPKVVGDLAKIQKSFTRPDSDEEEGDAPKQKPLLTEYGYLFSALRKHFINPENFRTPEELLRRTIMKYSPEDCNDANISSLLNQPAVRFKGASINYVISILGFLDPLHPHCYHSKLIYI